MAIIMITIIMITITTMTVTNNNVLQIVSHAFGHGSFAFWEAVREIEAKAPYFMTILTRL